MPRATPYHRATACQATGTTSGESKTALSSPANLPNDRSSALGVSERSAILERTTAIATIFSIGVQLLRVYADFARFLIALDGRVELVRFVPELHDSLGCRT